MSQRTPAREKVIGEVENDLPGTHHSLFLLQHFQMLNEPLVSHVKRCLALMQEEETRGQRIWQGVKIQKTISQGRTEVNMLHILPPQTLSNRLISTPEQGKARGTDGGFMTQSMTRATLILQS